ncbi:MAG: protein kinase [Pseudomonadota bacterium]|nr:MAG: protein kinase [Pseudomonadota bacterium]
MSIVYEAFDPHINRHLAVKVLRERFARDLKSRQRFLREARSAGGLSHPNIVTVFDVGQYEGQPYLVMERIPGQSLEAYLADGHHPDIDQTLSIAVQLSNALHYAHERGIIHRDVKPSNIYYNPESGLVKLVDFGIAAIIEGTDSGRRSDNTIAGTPKYMAPEHIQAREIDGRADLYALGVVLYRLLGDELPFDADSIGALAQQIVHHAPPRLRPRDGRTPVDLVDLVHRLLAKNADARPATGGQVLRELEEIRDDMDRGLLRAVRQHSSAWRWPLGLGLALAAVLGSGLAWVYQTQITAMTESTYGYGDALASVIARETAEALMLDDTTALSNLVFDFSVNPRVTFLHVSDSSGVVQASTNPFMQGETRAEPIDAKVEREQGGVRLIRRYDGDLEFRTPVRYQTRRIGSIQLGIDAEPLEAAARTTLLMLVLVFVVSLTVLGTGVVWFWRRHQRSLQQINRGLQRIGRGQFDTRLETDHRDALHSLYRQFNDMAVRLDQRFGSTAESADDAPLAECRNPEAATDETVELSAKDESAKILPITNRKRDG